MLWTSINSCQYFFQEENRVVTRAVKWNFLGREKSYFFVRSVVWSVSFLSLLGYRLLRNNVRRAPMRFNALSAILHSLLTMFRHLSYFQWQSCQLYWPPNKRLVLVHDNHRYQRTCSFIYNGHKRSSLHLNYHGYQNILRYQLIFITILLQIFVKLPGKQEATWITN